MIKFLIGGSPCTHWSIAQCKARETEPDGIGWELFKNYLIAKEKFRPDFFLYENNKSAAQSIKDRISEELETPLQYINSALVSAQNRWRFYAHNIPRVEQPEDRHIICDREKATCLLGTYDHAGARNYLKKNHGQMIFEPVTEQRAFPVGTTTDGKAYCLTANYAKGSNIKQTVGSRKRTLVAESVSTPAAFAGRVVGRRINEAGHRDDYNPDIPHIQRFEVNIDPQKTNTIFTCVSRMFGWVANSLILTYWSKVDKKMTRRLIDSIVDSVNIWLNGLVNEEKLLGGRVEFREDENSTVALMAGKAVFHIFMTPPSPMKECEFVLEYDVDYVSAALTA